MDEKLGQHRRGEDSTGEERTGYSTNERQLDGCDGSTAPSHPEHITLHHIALHHVTYIVHLYRTSLIQ